MGKMEYSYYGDPEVSAHLPPPTPTCSRREPDSEWGWRLFIRMPNPFSRYPLIFLRCEKAEMGNATSGSPPEG